MALIAFVGSKLRIFSVPFNGVINIWGFIPPFFVQNSRFLTFDIKKKPVELRPALKMISQTPASSRISQTF